MLQRIALFDTRGGRALTPLIDLPHTLHSTVERSDTEAIDSSKLVDAACGPGMLDEGIDALLVLLQNALDFSQGTAQGRELQALYEELSTPAAQSVAPTAPPPTSPTPPPAPSPRPLAQPPAHALICAPSPVLSPIERAERYRKLKAALAIGEREWRGPTR